MKERTDDAIESLLRQHFDGPVSDSGFSDRVMQTLPPRGRRVTWPLQAGILTGVVACWLGLLQAPLVSAGWSDWMGGEWSIPALTMVLAIAGMSLLAACWGVAEAGSS